jgi:FkbM family methyltransferase
MELDKSTPDWNLPSFHEGAYWKQYLNGGRTFIDIGAHVGTWTINLAKYYDRVIAFEPDPRGYTALKRNLELNNIKNVEVIPKAVSNKTETVKFNLFFNPCTNTLMDPKKMGRTDLPISEVEVETVSIDEFVKARGINDIDFIKIDAEGAELLIVEGGLNMFKTQTPDFFIEMHGLFYDRLKKILSFAECDVLDGGRAGLSLLKHRHKWPAFETEDFRVFPHGTSPTAKDQKELRLKHGIAWEAPGGFLAADYIDK